MSLVREEALLLLKRRVARMHKILFEFSTTPPDALIAWEARLIAKAGMMLDIDAWQSQEKMDLLREWKTGVGECLEDGCGEPVHVSPQDGTSPFNPFHTSYCQKHADEHKREMEDFEKAEQL